MGERGHSQAKHKSSCRRQLCAQETAQRGVSLRSPHLLTRPFGQVTQVTVGSKAQELLSHRLPTATQGAFQMSYQHCKIQNSRKKLDLRCLLQNGDFYHQRADLTPGTCRLVPCCSRPPTLAVCSQDSGLYPVAHLCHQPGPVGPWQLWSVYKGQEKPPFLLPKQAQGCCSPV